MNKVINLPLVVALAITVSACDTTSSDETKISQRDVYTSLEDCVADWGDTELCEKQQAEAKALAAKQAQSSGGNSMAFVPIFLGPSYSPGDRSTYLNGNRYTPATSQAASTASYLRNSKTGVLSAPSYAAPTKPTFNPSNPRPSFTSPAGGVSRGGFGSAGRGGSFGG